jgi:hypothetical protein
MQTPAAPLPDIKAVPDPSALRAQIRRSGSGPVGSRLAGRACAVRRRLLHRRTVPGGPQGGLMRKYRCPPSFRALQNVPGQIGFIHLCSPQLRLDCGLNRTTSWRFQAKNPTKAKPDAGWLVCRSLRLCDAVSLKRACCGVGADSSLTMSKAVARIVSACVEPISRRSSPSLRQGLAVDTENRTDCKVGAYRAQMGEKLLQSTPARQSYAALRIQSFYGRLSRRSFAE